MNCKGIGIIQLLVAVGLGSVVSMGVISMMHFSNQEQKKIQLRSELVAIQTRFAEVLHNDKTFLNTMDSAANPNMACLRNRTACAASYVSSSYTPTLDRIAIVHPASSDGRIFYDGRATSSAGFTEKGAACTGFSPTGAGNSACPIGFITNWHVNQAASTEGLALTINAKLIFNPEDTHPLKRLFYSPATDTRIGSYDLSVTKRVRSLVDNTVITCQQSGITLHNSATYTFYSTANVPAGSRCFQETRLCTVVNNTAVLSGTYTHPTCVQNCSGSWSGCSATCGGGTRTYTVAVPANQWGATSTCAAADGTVEACNTQSCAVNCVGDWSACANGTRTYTITTPAAHGGANCSFTNGQTQSCGVNCAGTWGGCVNGAQTYTITTPASGGGAACTATNGQIRACGTNCVGSWGNCSSGSQTFTITTPASGGGTACTAANGQTRSCGTNCVGAWGNCAGGVQTYSISSPASGGGAACEATSGATRSCGTNCVGSWGSCSNGSQTYTITTPASGGGTACTESNGQTRTCGTNCVGSWGSYGSCSATCGGGTQTRTFTVTTAASGGGSACAATHGQTQSQSCNTDACNTDPVNCVGAWAPCTSNGMAITYVVTTPASNGGTACAVPAGTTATCTCSCYCSSWSCNYPYNGSGKHSASTKAACMAANGQSSGGCTTNGCVWVGGPGNCQ